MADALTDPASPEQIYVLRRALIKHRRLQTYSLTMLRESAIMAAFQTVEVRLTMLENKGQEETTISDLIWEATVAACFGYAGSLVERGLTATFNSILKTRVAYTILPKTELGGWVKEHQSREWESRVGKYSKQLKDRYKISRNPAETATMWDEFRPLLRKEEADLKLFQQGFLDQNDVRLLYHEFTFKAVDPLIKSASNLEGITENLKKLLINKGATPLNKEDYPTVRVLRSALEFFDRQIETQHLVLDEFDLALACGRYTAEEFETLWPILIPGADAFFDSITLNLDIWIRFFEFCIWVTLFPGEKLVKGLNRPPAYIDNVPRGELQTYLIKRILAKYERLPDNSRPPTILEDAFSRTRPNRDVQTYLATVKRGAKPDNDLSNRAIEWASPEALNNLAAAWTKMSADMAQATRKLYASTRSG